MMGHRAKLKGGDEYDAFHRAARRVHIYLGRSKVVKKIKRKFWKRQRKINNVSGRDEM